MCGRAMEVIRIAEPHIFCFVINEDFLEFDCISALMEDLKSISFGVYQIEQARCYISNHLYEI